MTAVRIVEDIGAYHAIVFSGEALQSELRQGYMPSVDIRIDGDIEKLVANYNGQHYAFAYGDWTQDVIEYCRLTGMRVICI